MFKLLYQGIDALDIAFQGALRPDVIEYLKTARADAEEADEKQLITFGPGNVDAHVSPHGRKGGYRFVLDTGPEGAQWWLKANLRRDGWNGFVTPKSGMLVTRSLDEVQQEIWETLGRMGFEVTGHTVNRVDYAMDFATEEFEPSPNQFVAHSNCKTKPHYGSKEIDDALPSVVTRGRRVESVTIGKMPGRQIIVYDKRRDSIVKQKLWWFPVWGISKDDNSREIWRVEVRAGKKELKEKWNLRTVDELQSSLGDLVRRSLKDVRYVSPSKSDSNVSRRPSHPLWEAVVEALNYDGALVGTGLLPSAVREVQRQIAIKTFKSLILGNAIGLASALDWTTEETKQLLAGEVAMEISKFLRCFPDDFDKKLRKARARYTFLK